MEGGDSGDMSEISRSATPASIRSAEIDPEDELATRKDSTPPNSIFEMVTTELFKIGAIPLERFATEDNPEEDNIIKFETFRSHLTKEKAGDEKDVKMQGKGKEHFQAVAKIYEACMRTFESSEAINFGYKDDLGPGSRECILTVTRPDGRSRSYTSGPFFSNKSDAKSQVASVAVGLNVINFIKYGDVNTKSRSNAVVESLNAPARLKVDDGKGLSFVDQKETVVDDANVRSISKCCVEWRAGLIKPIYIHFSEPTIIPRVQGKRSKTLIPPTEDELMTLKQGCALKVEISQHTTRVYSVHHIYKTRAEAKAAVALVAINQGVLDFIKYANGQTAPMVFVRELEGDPDENLNREVINETNKATQEVIIDATAVNVTLKKHQIPLDAMTLQAFTNSLPKPFPETPGLKPTGEGNPVGWLNAAAQSARGSRMSITWTYLSNAKLSSHGCLVRFNLPRIEEGRSYLVEPQFTKRSDAKSAVALLAISQNVGGWVHEISTAVENLITPEMRTRAGSLMAPLNQECTRARIVGQPTYSYVHEEGAVGCTLRVEFSSELWKEYTVPVQYRTKPDARLASILQAHHAGIIEFIRFRGADPPADYKPEQPYDWKIARKIEEAQSRGDSLLQAGYSETSLVKPGSGGSIEEPNLEMSDENNSFRGSRYLHSQLQHSSSAGSAKIRDLQRPSYPRGSYPSRGRFSEGARGKAYSQSHTNADGQRSSSTEHPGTSRPRSGSRQIFYPGTDIIAGALDVEALAPREDRRRGSTSWGGAYEYPSRIEHDAPRVYGTQQYAPPVLPHTDHYYPHHPLAPLGAGDEHYSYPDHPPYSSSGPDAGPFGSRFYSSMPAPPLPHVNSGPSWVRHDGPPPGPYPYPPGAYYDDYVYDEAMPADEEWSRGADDRGRYNGAQFEDRKHERPEKRPRGWSAGRSPNRFEGNSNHNQRHFKGASRGRARGVGKPHYPESRTTSSGLGRTNKPADDTPFVPADGLSSNPHSLHMSTSKRDDATGWFPKSDWSPKRATERNLGEIDREQQATRKRPRQPSPATPNSTAISRQASSSATKGDTVASGSHQRAGIGAYGRYETALNEHCLTSQIRKPVFKSEALPNGKYSVSVIVDREKFSLPTPFDSVAQGREEVAKQVVHRIKAVAKRRRESDA